MNFSVVVDNEAAGSVVRATLLNDTKDALHLYFPTSQRLSVRLYDSADDNALVYVSEREWMYMQVVEDVYVASGEEVVYEEKIPNRLLSAGHSYQGVVKLTAKKMNGTSVSEKVQQPVTFTRQA
ncbi:BsuPI-related putative proteinase inhibitor [Geomicrobium sp. JSM 1781026]|uniref:BsuPI-related putative proteinase inhibitor n=1 Tax=Geomicrobium sp. JSM 1781026 TaxID=3344580 RepID=UPI0035BF3293